MPTLLIQAACLVVLAAPLDRLPPEGPGPFNFALTDQVGRRCPVSAHFGDVFVIVYGDKQALDADCRIQALLTAAFYTGGRTADQAADAPRVKPVDGAPPGSRSPDVRVASAACLQGYPNPAVQSLVRRQLATRHPNAVILVDFEDKVRQTFGLTPGASHVIVFDAHGRPRLRMVGVIDEPSLAALVRGVEELRKEAAFPPP